LQNAEEKIIEVYSPRNDIEAGALLDLLNQNGIKALLQESYLTLRTFKRSCQNNPSLGKRIDEIENMLIYVKRCQAPFDINLTSLVA